MPKQHINKPDNTFQIIAGDYRHKKFNFIGDSTLRPTAGRIRETLFNWLQFNIAGKTVLDCFAGSGALGFEALSRGAKEVILVEKNIKSAEQININIKQLGSANVKLINADIFATRLKQTFDIVFLDPPFHTNLIATSLEFLLDNKLIDNNSLIYIESSQIINYPQLKVLKHKQTKTIHYALTKVSIQFKL